MKKLTGIVVLDGPDGAGKTTLAKVLVEKYDGLYVHLGYKKRIFLLQTAALRWALRNCGHRLVVIDRHWMSSDVYGQHYRGDSDHGSLSRSFYRAIVGRPSVHVVCAPPIDYVRDTMRRLKTERHEMYQEGHERIAERYMDLVQGNILRGTEMWNFTSHLAARGGVKSLPYDYGWLHYDVTRHAVSQVGRWAESEIAHRLRWRAQGMDEASVSGDHARWLSGYTGFGTTLLVGDSPRYEKGAVLPFHYNGNSSKFLHDALHMMSANEARICLVNVNDPLVGPEEIARVKAIAEKARRVVALGQLACETLIVNKVTPHAVSRHPAYARRFGHDLFKYKDILEKDIYGGC